MNRAVAGPQGKLASPEEEPAGAPAPANWAVARPQGKPASPEEGPAGAPAPANRAVAGTQGISASQVRSGSPYQPSELDHSRNLDGKAGVPGAGQPSPASTTPSRHQGQQRQRPQRAHAPYNNEGGLLAAGHRPMVPVRKASRASPLGSPGRKVGGIDGFRRGLEQTSFGLSTPGSQDVMKTASRGEMDAALTSLGVGGRSGLGCGADVLDRRRIIRLEIPSSTTRGAQRRDGMLVEVCPAEMLTGGGLLLPRTVPKRAPTTSPAPLLGTPANEEPVIDAPLGEAAAGPTSPLLGTPASEESVTAALCVEEAAGSPGPVGTGAAGLPSDRTTGMNES